MAIAYLGSDGFDNGTLRFVTGDMSGNVALLAVPAPHTGAYSLRLGAHAGTIRYSVTGTPANCSVSFWINLSTHYDVTAPPVYFYLTTGETIGIIWDFVNHTYDAYVDDVKVADGTVTVLMNDWFQVQLYAVIDNAGSIQVKIGGQLSIDYSGDTLPIGAAAQVEYVYFSMVGDAGTYLYLDDIVWGTGGYLGDCRVEWLPPDADTGVDDWLKSVGGDAYAVVDEIPASNADYLYTDTDAQSTELELTDWDDTDKTPLFVTAWARAYEDAATAESLKVGVDSGGVDDVTEYIMTDAYQYYDHFMDENPDGPAAWDNAAIDALKHRLESVI